MQSIFSSPARLPGFLPTMLHCSRAGELKMLCIMKVLHNQKELDPHRQSMGGPKVATILSAVEIYRRLKLRVRDYLAAVLPGLGDLSIRCLPDRTPGVWGAPSWRPHCGRLGIVMMIRAVTIEREFGGGGLEIAAKLAEVLVWKLWDRELVPEIARLTNSTPQAVEQREWKNDPAVYRVFKSFPRGAYEGSLPPTDRLELLDAQRIPAVSEQAVDQVLSSGPCAIVGRGSQYSLRNRKDVFRVFLYASRTSKIHRLITAGIYQEKAITDVDTIDKDRAAFIKRYLKSSWPDHHLYDAMFNTETGDSFVADMLVRCVQQVAGPPSGIPEFTERLTVIREPPLSERSGADVSGVRMGDQCECARLGGSPDA